MGFLNFFNNSRKDDLKLIEWQNIVYNLNYDKLIVSKEQLTYATKTYVLGQSSIIDDCVNLVNDTTTINVFFYRLELLIEILQTLSILEEYFSFEKPLPSIQLSTVLSHKELIIDQFIDRCWENTLKSASLLKTEKGKKNKLSKCFDSILTYKHLLASNNIDYLNKLNNEWLDSLTSHEKELTNINNTNSSCLDKTENIDIDQTIKELKAWTKGEKNPNLDKLYEEYKENYNK